MPSHGPINVPGNRHCRNYLPCKRGQSRTESEVIILSKVLVVSTTLLLTISIVPRALSQVIPNQSSLWQGMHNDLSSFVTKPALERSALTAFATTPQTRESFSIPYPSSRKTATQISWYLQCFSRGLRIFVNTWGADHNPKGINVNA